MAQVGDDMAFLWTDSYGGKNGKRLLYLSASIGIAILLLLGLQRAAEAGTSRLEPPLELAQFEEQAVNNGPAAVLDDVATWFSEQSDLSVAVAWGDVDNDGDLDLAVADVEGANRVYLNTDGRLEEEASWTALDGSGARSTDVAWGDVDGDGDLDLAASYIAHNRIYYNDNGRLQNFAAWGSVSQNNLGSSLAWGDINADGHLDLVVGIYGVNFNGFVFFGNDQIYFNDGAGHLSTTPGWASAESVNTNDIAVADVNTDGFLDIVTADSGPNFGNTTQGRVNRVYLNNAGVMPTVATSSWGEADNSTGVALGDMNGDGFVDAAVSNMPVIIAGTSFTPQTKVYLNSGGSFANAAVWATTTGDYSQGVDWGDADGDGDLDLAVAVQPQSSTGVDVVGGQNRVYLNENGLLSTTPNWTDSAAVASYDVAWGDLNDDGQLDLAVANLAGQDKVFLNRHVQMASTPTRITAEADASIDVAWGDYDGDGDLDLAVANAREIVNGAFVGGENRVYVNENGVLTSGWLSAEQEDSFSAAWGDVDGDGTLELAVGNGAVQLSGFENPPSPNRLYAVVGGQTAVWTSDENDDTFQVAWGDVDGDGDLDLAAANSTNTFSPTLGVVFFSGAPNRVYINHEGVLETTASWQSDDNDRTLSVAWGDVDGDGDLDLAVGNARAFDNELNTFGGQNKLYLNDNGTLLNPAVWSSKEFEDTRSVAWGDVDGDGDLDLAVGNGLNPNRIYFNIGGRLQRQAGWFSFDEDDTYRVVWADADRDGDLDLFAANNNGPDKLYLNVNGTLQRTAAWTSAANFSTSLAVGDVDADGDLDIATSQMNPANNSGRPNQLYTRGAPAHPRAVGQSEAIVIHPQFAGQPSSLAPAPGYAVPTVRAGNIPISYTLYHPLGRPYGWVRGFYSLDGGNNWLEAVPTAETPLTQLASTPFPTPTLSATHVYTWNTLASGVFGQSDNVVFRLEAYPQPSPAGAGTYLYPQRVPGPYQRPFVATQTYPFRLRGTQVRVLSGTTPISNALVYRLPAGQTVGGTPLQDREGIPFHTDNLGYLQGRATLKAGDSLLALVPVTSTRATGGAMSFDGVDDYIIRNPVLADFPQEAITVAFWMQGDGSAANRPTPFSYATYRFDDEFLIFDANNISLHREFQFLNTGISANDGEWHHIAVTWRGADGQAVLYKDGTAVFTGTLAPGTTLDPGGSFLLGQEQDSLEGGFQQFQAFKGLMDEVEVWNRALTAAEVREGMENGRFGDEAGLVLYWTFDEDGGQLTADKSGSGSHGRVQGATHIGVPGGYTVYYTNGQPQDSTVTGQTVTAASVQTLTVSADHPLILFDIDLSLEWDASQDPTYLDQLRFDLQQTSAHLYDFTDGQVALGEVTVSQNGDNWLFSDVVVRATNRLRPFAIQGGVVLTPTTDPDHPDIFYTHPHETMGSTWSRYGNAGQNLGGDWSVILAHELSHYLLYLDDTYLGLNEAGLLVPISNCTGSAMGDPYLPSNTEFLTAVEWLPKCAQTLTHRTLQRSEWETLQLWYPWLQAPQPPFNPGPTLMPFGFTEVNILQPEKPGDPLLDPTFFIDYANAAVSSSEANGYLVSALAGGNDYVVALGNPATGQNRLLARGAKSGDRLCIFDPARQQYGCEIIAAGDNRIALEHDASWRPLIQIRPINTTTLAIEVALGGEPLPLRGRLFPDIGRSTEPITLTEHTVQPDGTRLYSATITLDVLSLSGYMQLWVDEPAAETDPRREVIVTYGIGGNPGLARGAGGLARGAGGLARGAGGLARGAGGLARGAGGLARGAGAPLLSPDGQFILFTENPASFKPGELYAIQQLSSLPPLPAGKTALGPGYRLVASPNVTRVLTGSVSFQYLGLDALNDGVDEGTLTIHFWDGAMWRALATTRDSYYNLASADSAGTGVYALLAGVTKPQITALEPSLVLNGADAALKIVGADFLPPVRVEIAAAGATYTLPLTAVTSGNISATVPAGLPAAEYTLTLFNGDGGVSQGVPLAIFDPAQACFYDFFESGSSQWTRSGEWDIVALQDGNLAMTDSPLGNYASADPTAGSRLTAITSPPFSLLGCADPVLTFDHAFVLAMGSGHEDSGRVEISADGGQTWDVLARYTGGGVFGPPQEARSAAAASSEWQGSQWRGGWFDLSDYSGDVQLRFSLLVDEAVADKGWLIDNVMVRPGAAAPSTADLGLEIAYSGPPTVEAGSVITYLLTAVNSGPDVVGAVISATVEGGGMETLTCTDGCTISSNSVSWTLPPIFNTQGMMLTVATTANYTGTLSVTATAAAATPSHMEINSTNNRAVVNGPEIIVVKKEPVASLNIFMPFVIK